MTDAKCFSGWVADMDDTKILVNCRAPEGLQYEDKFFVEVHGMDRSAQFKAWVGNVDGNAVSLVIFDAIRYYPARENGRLFVDNIPGSVVIHTVRTNYDVVDISRAGFGLIADRVIDRGIHTFKLQTPDGEIEVEGEVRYCRPDENSANKFRVGVLILSMDRLCTARWARLFMLAA